LFRGSSYATGKCNATDSLGSTLKDREKKDMGVLGRHTSGAANGMTLLGYIDF